MDLVKNTTDSFINLKETHEDTGLFLNVEDCKYIYKRLKKEENHLQDEERIILQRLEKLLYSRLSINEIEAL